MSQERIEQIDKELDGYKDVMTTIDALRKERAAIVKKQKEDEFDKLSFEKKFEQWFGKKKILSDVFELKRQAPKFYKKFVDTINRKYDYHRYATYRVDEYFEDDFYPLLDEDVKMEMHGEYKTTEEFQKEYDELLECAKELYSKNIVGWVHDW